MSEDRKHDDLETISIILPQANTDADVDDDDDDADDGYVNRDLFCQFAGWMFIICADDRSTVHVLQHNAQERASLLQSLQHSAVDAKHLVTCPAEARTSKLTALRGHSSSVTHIYCDDWCDMSDHVIVQVVDGSVYVWSLSTAALIQHYQATSKELSQFLMSRRIKPLIIHMSLLSLLAAGADENVAVSPDATNADDEVMSAYELAMIRGTTPSAICYEHQRFYPIIGWSSHLLPNDRLHDWSNESGSRRQCREDFTLLNNGWTWTDQWHCVIVTKKEHDRSTAATDVEGWSYAIDFPRRGHPFRGRPHKVFFHNVRRRQWIRHRAPIVLAESLSLTENKSFALPETFKASRNLSSSDISSQDDTKSSSSLSLPKRRTRPKSYSSATADQVPASLRAPDSNTSRNESDQQTQPLSSTLPLPSSPSASPSSSTQPRHRQRLKLPASKQVSKPLSNSTPSSPRPPVSSSASTPPAPTPAPQSSLSSLMSMLKSAATSRITSQPPPHTSAPSHISSQSAAKNKALKTKSKPKPKPIVSSSDAAQSKDAVAAASTSRRRRRTPTVIITHSTSPTNTDQALTVNPSLPVNANLQSAINVAEFNSAAPTSTSNTLSSANDNSIIGAPISRPDRSSTAPNLFSPEVMDSPPQSFSPPNEPSAASTVNAVSAAPAASKIIPNRIFIWECQRHYPIIAWSSRLFPTDPPTWHDSRGRACDKAHAELLCPPNHEWTSEWIISYAEESDDAGWLYAVDFDKWTFGERTVLTQVRKRGWWREHAFLSNNDQPIEQMSRRRRGRTTTAGETTDVVATTRRTRRSDGARETRSRTVKNGSVNGARIRSKSTPRMEAEMYRSLSIVAPPSVEDETTNPTHLHPRRRKRSEHEIKERLTKQSLIPLPEL